jgi:hypothetical protein
MFKRLRFIKKRCLNNLRCYAAPHFNQDFEDNLLNYYTQDHSLIPPNHSLIGNNIDTNQQSIRFDENPPEQTNLMHLKEVENERPLNALNFESQFDSQNMLIQNLPTFLEDLAANPWGFIYYHSQYKMNGSNPEKYMLKETESRDQSSIIQLFKTALNSNHQLALGVNLSSNIGRYSNESDFVVIDIDPPKGFKWHPLEGQILKLVLDYYMNEGDRIPLSEVKSDDLTLPFIVKTPRGLHMLFRGPIFESSKRKYKRDKRLLKLGISAEYIVSGNINLFGWPYEMLLCPKNIQNLAYLPDFLTPGEIQKKFNESDQQPINNWIEKGERNETLFQISRQSKTLTLDTLMRINRYFCKEPLKDDEVARIFESSTKYRQKETKEITVVSSENSMVSIHNNIRDALVRCGEIPDNAEGDHPITAGAVMRAALKCETAQEGSVLVNAYFKAFHHEQGTYGVLTGLLTGFAEIEMEKGLISLLRVYKQSKEYLYKYYDPDNGIWMNADEDAIERMILVFLCALHLGDFQTPQKIANIRDRLIREARPGNLPLSHGVQFRNGFLNFIKGSLEPTSPFNYAQWSIDTDVEVGRPMDKSVIDYWFQIGKDSSLQIKTINNFILLGMLFISEVPYSLYLCGPPGSGKSVFINLIEELFNVYCQNVEFKSIAGDFGAVNLVNKLILTCHEIPSRLSQQALNNLKMIISSDIWVQRKIFTDTLVEVKGGLFIGCANKKWELGDDIVPFFRRVVYVESRACSRQQQQNAFKDILKKNIPAITRYVMNGHYLQFQAYAYHEEIEAAIHADLTQSPIVLWLKNTSELYYVQDGDCVIKSEPVTIKKGSTFQEVPFLGVHNAFLNYANKNHSGHDFCNISESVFYTLFNETNRTILRAPIEERPYSRHLTIADHPYITGTFVRGYRNAIVIDRTRTDNAMIPMSHSFILQKEHTTNPYLEKFIGKRFTKIVNRVSLITLLVSCIYTPLSEKYDLNTEIYLRYKISPGLLLLLIELIKQGPPEWAQNLLKTSKTNQHDDLSQVQTENHPLDNFPSAGDLKITYGPKMFLDVARWMTRYIKDKPEWVDRPPVNINTVLQSDLLGGSTAYVAGDCLRLIDSMNPNEHGIKIGFDGDYRKSFEQMATVNCKGYLSLRKSSLYPNHYQVVVETGSYVIDDLFIDLYNSSGTLKEKLDLELHVPTTLPKPNNNNYTDHLIGELRNAQCSSKNLYQNSDQDIFQSLFQSTRFDENPPEQTNLMHLKEVEQPEITIINVEQIKPQDVKPRKRGRPPKKSQPANNNQSSNDENINEKIIKNEEVQPQEIIKPRKRGRPKKNTVESTNTQQKETIKQQEVIERKRGRPKKKDSSVTTEEKARKSHKTIPEAQVADKQTVPEKAEPRKRGRPKKKELNNVAEQIDQPNRLVENTVNIKDNSLQEKFHTDNSSCKELSNVKSYTQEDVEESLKGIVSKIRECIPSMLSSKLPIPPHYRVYLGLEMPEKWMKHKLYPYGSVPSLLRPFIIFFYHSLIADNNRSYQDFYNLVKGSTSDPLTQQILDGITEYAEQQMNKKDFKVFVYEFNISYFMNKNFNSNWLNKIQLENINVLFNENTKYIKDQESPDIQKYPYIDVEIKSPNLFDQPNSWSWDVKRVINKFSEPWGSQSTSFSPQIKHFFSNRQEYWMKYFKNSPLIKGLNEICEPIIEMQYDLLQGTFGCYYHMNVLAGTQTEYSDFPWSGSRRCFKNMFTIDVKRNNKNPGRFDQKDSVFLTMRKELREVYSSLMFSKGFGQDFYKHYSFGNIDIKAAHTYAVAVLMRKEMPTLSNLLKQSVDIWKEAERLSPSWAKFKDRIGQKELLLKPFLKILFYGALNGGNVSNPERVADKIRSLLVKNRLQEHEQEISGILCEHPIINEVSVFLQFCNKLDGSVQTPLQDECVDKRQTPSDELNVIRKANYKLASTLLQCVEFITIIAAMDAFVQTSINQNLDMHIILNLHDGFLFVYNNSINITEVHKEIEESCSSFYKTLFKGIPPQLELTLGEEFVTKYIEKQQEQSSIESFWNQTQKNAEKEVKNV